MRKKSSGFTLIELLIVIAIIGILAILIFIALERAQKNARDAQRKAFARDIATAEALYYDSHKTYAKPGVLADDKLISRWPTVCPDGQTYPGDDCNTDNRSRDMWNAKTEAPGKNFKVSVILESSGKGFECDQSGCGDT